MNEKNLVPFKPGQGGFLSPEVQEKAQQTRRKNAKIRKTIRNELQLMLQEQCENDQGQVITLREGITAALIKAALGGNTKAFELIRDTIGEKPTDKLDVTTSEIDVMDQVDRRMQKFRDQQE